MNMILSLLSYIAAHYMEIAAAISAVCAALIALFLMIPGEQPEKALQSVVDFLSKFSKK